MLFSGSYSAITAPPSQTISGQICRSRLASQTQNTKAMRVREPNVISAAAWEPELIDQCG
jgi:hypothetical protein